MKSTLELSVKENIEMELFSSEEKCVVTKTQEEKTPLHQQLLTLDTDDDSGQRNSTLDRGLGKQSLFTVTEIQEELLIEMEILRSLKMTKYKMACESKARHLKWKKLPLQKSRFVVKDVVFLPKDQYLAQIESQEVSAVTARMTVDYSWSAAEMDSRLRLVLRRQFGKAAARNINFTCLQVKSEQPLLQSKNNRKEFCPEINKDNDISSKRSEELRSELRSVLTSFTQEALGVELPLQVRRTAVLPWALKTVRRTGFCFRDVPVISFSGEETEGNLGPLREFFRLMLEELQKTALFEGQPDRLLLTSDLSALEDWGYYEAGVLIGWSLAHGGTGPRCLHPALFRSYVWPLLFLDDFCWRDVVDFEVQSHLQQLQTCSDVELLSPSVCEWVSNCGVPEISSATTEEIPNIYRRVVKHYIYNRVSRMIDQFTQGLNSFDGLWDVMRSHCEAFAPVMTSAGSRSLTLPNFSALFTVSFSSDCEKLKEEETKTAAHWETALGLIRDGEAALSFKDLLIFVSGLYHVPPLGFSSSISLRFYSQNLASSVVRLPFASTCSLELFLPRG
ncbi:hypothetical protein WMY93_024594 [Mugilogobius chulae]|uniref:HECT domain-containing protein n=1 Tax=Mugilogobius chulae TaxID=88201 RepID=A0AAW0NC41_9GOBI